MSIISATTNMCLRIADVGAKTAANAHLRITEAGANVLFPPVPNVMEGRTFMHFLDELTSQPPRNRAERRLVERKGRWHPSVTKILGE